MFLTRCNIRAVEFSREHEGQSFFDLGNGVSREVSEIFVPAHPFESTSRLSGDAENTNRYFDKLLVSLVAHTCGEANDNTTKSCSLRAGTGFCGPNKCFNVAEAREEILTSNITVLAHPLVSVTLPIFVH